MQKRLYRIRLERFDRVLGSAEALSDAVEGSSRIARRAFSVPVIKVAGIAVGTRRAANRLRSREGTTDVEVLTPINRGRRRA